MIGEYARNIRMSAQKLGFSTSLRLGEGIGASTRLNVFRCPFIWIVAVDIQTFTGWSDRNGKTIVIADQAFGDDMVVSSIFLINFTAAHDTWIFVGTFPRAVRIFDSHFQDQAV